MSLKPCTGCKHLVARTVCAAKDVLPTLDVNPYTGRNEYHYTLRPTVREMRQPTAECGPEAKLWTPNWRRRLLAKFRAG